MSDHAERPSPTIRVIRGIAGLIVMAALGGVLTPDLAAQRAPVHYDDWTVIRTVDPETEEVTVEGVGTRSGGSILMVSCAGSTYRLTFTPNSVFDGPVEVTARFDSRRPMPPGTWAARHQRRLYLTTIRPPRSEARRLLEAFPRATRLRLRVRQLATDRRGQKVEDFSFSLRGYGGAIAYLDCGGARAAESD